MCGGAILDKPRRSLACSEECSQLREQRRKQEYYRQNRERILTQQKNYYQLNRDKRREWERAWRKTEKGLACITRSYNKRRRLLAGAMQEPWLRSEIAERDNWYCYLCGEHIEPGDLNIDHVKPLALGGDDAPWNVAATHAVCNFRKRANFPEGAKLKALELASLHKENVHT